jgi:peptidyl-lysine (3S)-dioxygenase / protease
MHIENDNLRNEYADLYADVQKDIAFARIALQKPPDAINLWIGNSKSVTALHKDPMENIYVQIIGRKHFVLMPPLCFPCVNERMLRPATYRRTEGELVLHLDREQDPVPLATWDPDQPERNATRHSHLAEPVKVTLEPGDMLYLPAMW